jgi:serine/threonine protein kinase
MKITHNDLKPENIMVDKDIIMLIDFDNGKNFINN